MARIARAVHSIPAVGLRLFNVYGPRQSPRAPYASVIAIFCERIMTGRPITIFGDGHQTRDFLYIDDAVTALLAAMEHLPLVPETSSTWRPDAASPSSISPAGSASMCGVEAADLVRPGAPSGDIRYLAGDASRAPATIGLLGNRDRFETGTAETIRFLSGPLAVR